MEAEHDNTPIIRMLVAESQGIILHSILALLGTFRDVVVVGTARDGKTLLGLLEVTKPDILLLDLEKPGMSCIEVSRVIDGKMPWVKLISLSRHNHPYYIREMLKHGTKGFLSKDCSVEELHDGIRRVHAGQTFFCSTCSDVMLQDYKAQPRDDGNRFREITHREIEIIRYLAEGHSTKEIAEKLFISDKTVERHKSNLLKKMQLKNTPQLVKVAVENGLLIY